MPRVFYYVCPLCFMRTASINPADRHCEYCGHNEHKTPHIKPDAAAFEAIRRRATQSKRRRRSRKRPHEFQND